MQVIIQKRNNNSNGAYQFLEDIEWEKGIELVNFTFAKNICLTARNQH